MSWISNASPITRYLSLALVVSVAACSQDPAVGPKSIDVEEDIGTTPDLGVLDVRESMPTALVIEPAMLSVEVGRTANLEAQLLDADGVAVPGPIQWASSDAASVEVTATGVVIGHEIGVATVTASSGALQGEASVRVTGPPVARIEVSPTSRDMRVGDTVTINIAMYDGQNAPIDDPRDIGFASSADNIVTVDAAGLVTAVSEGSATITTSVEGVVATSEITVIGGDPIDRVELQPVAFELSRGETQQMSASAFVGGSSVANASFDWTSSAPGVASIDATGLVTAVSKGTATITATSSGVAADAAVTVTFAFTRVAAGHDFACGLAEGAAYCWGRNDAGQLGRTDSNASPGPVATALRFTDVVAAQNHACGVTNAGAAHCWGAGQSAVVPVGGGHAFGSLYAGFGQTCGVEGQALWCWSPGGLPALAGSFGSSAIGGSHQCAVSGNTASCWGDNSAGQLGINVSGGSYPTPQTVSGGFTFAEMVAGRDHTCGTTTSGAALCWGANDVGQVGDGTDIDRVTPLLLSGAASISRLTAGVDHSCGLASDGRAFCWGRNDGGSLGTGSAGTVALPTAVSTSARFTQLAAGDQFTCGLSVDGELYCWGVDDHGQVGPDGPSSTPILITGF